MDVYSEGFWSVAPDSIPVAAGIASGLWGLAPDHKTVDVYSEGFWSVAPDPIPVAAGIASGLWGLVPDPKGWLTLETNGGLRSIATDPRVL